MTQNFFLKLREKVFLVSLKDKYIYFLVLLALILFLPLIPAQAQWSLPPVTGAFQIPARIMNWATNLFAKEGGTQLFAITVGSLLTEVLVLILRVTLFLTSTFFNISHMIFNWVTSPNFISLSYTQPNQNNPVIEAGWGLTRDLANIGIVASLIVIGLGTALMKEGYQIKKALPKLIIIALLINFTPVICGLIVDASNILMHSLLPESGFDFSPILNNFTESFETLQGNFSRGSLETIARLFSHFLALNAFAIFAGLTFITLSAVFILRYVAIWILVILSPLAFLAYIFPKTRGYWSKWWGIFLNWCFIGVTAAFFIFLSDRVLRAVTNASILGTALTSPEDSSQELSDFVIIMNSLLPYSVVIFFLWFGFFSALSTSAAGANVVISFAQKTAKDAGKWAEQKAGKEVERKALGPAAERMAQALEKTRFSRAPIIRGATQGLIDYAAGQRKAETPKNWSEMTPGEKEMYANAQSQRDYLQTASKMVGEGSFTKTSESFQNKAFEVAEKFAADPRYKKQVGDIIETMPANATKALLVKEIGEEKANEQIKKVQDELKESLGEAEIKEKTRVKRGLENIDDVTDEMIGGYLDDTAAQIIKMRKLKAGDMAKLTKSSMQSDSFRIAMRGMSSSHIQSIRSANDEETLRSILDEEGGLNTLTEEELWRLSKNNRSLYTWAYRSPAGREILRWPDKWKEEPLPPARAFETPPSSPGVHPTHTNENLENFYKLTEKNITNIGLKGEREKTAALRRLTMQREPDINEYVDKLRKAGDPEYAKEANKIENMWIYIHNHPNYS